MQRSRLLLATIAILATPVMACAASTRLDLDQLHYDTIYDAARRSILAVDGQGRPLVVLLRIGKGQLLPPHGAEGGVRLLTVVKGTLSWGDGDEIDPASEHRYGPGSVIVVPAQGGEHWAAAREDDVLLQVVPVPEAGLAAEAKAQLAR